MRRYSLIVCVFCLLLLLAACGGPSAATESPATEPPATEPAATAEPTPEPTPTPTPEPTPEPLYQFGTAVEESAPLADDSYFDDAAFVGDSRTEGLQLYGGIHTGAYLCKQSMSVFHVNDSDYSVTVDGSSYTLMDALKARQYGKVYIMLGLNELGYPSASYEKQLNAFLDEVIAAQPDAVIYLELMPPVNDAMANSEWKTNANVDIFNEINTRAAADKHIALLNVPEVYQDENGQLDPELASGDGCHFTAEAYPLWADYLRNHIIDSDWYFASRTAAGPAAAEGVEE